MPWPLSFAWRYVATAVALVPASVHLPMPRSGVASTVVGACLVAVGPLVFAALWRCAVRPRRGAPRLHSVPDADRPYRRDPNARLVVDRRGWLFSRRVQFTGSGLPWRTLRSLPRDYGERFVRPVTVHTESRHTWWIVGHEFYRVSASYSRETAAAAIEATRRRRGPRWEGPAERPTGAAVDERRRTFLATCRPSLGRHQGLVCVRCRTAVDPRDEAVARLWTEGGLRASDAEVWCATCGSRAGVSRATAAR
ncbi:MAG: hypothetical protein ACFCVF_06315 [Kineosporiaceae bacterium]